jgi:hypothetical protein
MLYYNFIFDELILTQFYCDEKMLNIFSKCDNSIVKPLIDLSVHLFNNGDKKNHFKYL